MFREVAHSRLDRIVWLPRLTSRHLLLGFAAPVAQIYMIGTASRASGLALPVVPFTGIHMRLSPQLGKVNDLEGLQNRVST